MKDLTHDRRLNIRMTESDYERLQEIKRARLKPSDSETIRTLIDEEHDGLRASGAFRTVEKLQQQAAPEPTPRKRSYHENLAALARKKKKGKKRRGMVLPKAKRK